MWAISPITPFGRNSPVASVSSFPSRAAMAPPSMPSHSVNVAATDPDPGIAAPKNRREKISASGRIMMPPSARLAMRFSVSVANAFSNYLPLDFLSASRSCTAMSNTSAGTIEPRIVDTSWVAAVRNSAAALGSSVMT